jgi:stage III sporulation protein AB
MILEMLMSEIRYGKAALPECCRHLAGRFPEPYQSCFERIWREIGESGAAFQDVFCRDMELCLLELPLKKEDRDIFLQPFRKAGFQDGEMQLNHLKQSLEQLVDCIEILEREQREKCRMAVGLGAMSGLLLLIILV